MGMMGVYENVKIYAVFVTLGNLCYFQHFFVIIEETFDAQLMRQTARLLNKSIVAEK